MHFLQCLRLFVSYHDITIYIYTYSRSGQQLRRSPVKVCYISIFFSLNPHAKPTSIPLPLALLMIISTPNMDWTPPGFRKQFSSTVPAGQPQLPTKYIKLPFLLSSNYMQITSSAILFLFVAFLAQDDYDTTIEVKTDIVYFQWAAKHLFVTIDFYLEQALQRMKTEYL